jgi:hypothetical protein
MISRQQAKNDFLSDHFAGVGKMVAGGKWGLPKMALEEKDAGGLISDKKNNAE